MSLFVIYIKIVINTFLPIHYLIGHGKECKHIKRQNAPLIDSWREDKNY